MYTLRFTNRDGETNIALGYEYTLVCKRFDVHGTFNRRYKEFKQQDDCYKKESMFAFIHAQSGGTYPLFKKIGTYRILTENGCVFETLTYNPMFDDSPEEKRRKAEEKS